MRPTRFPFRMAKPSCCSTSMPELHRGPRRTARQREDAKKQTAQDDSILLSAVEHEAVGSRSYGSLSDRSTAPHRRARAGARRRHGRRFSARSSRADSSFSAATSSARATSEADRRSARSLAKSSRSSPSTRKAGASPGSSCIGNEPPNAQQLRDQDDPGFILRHGDDHRRGCCGIFGFNLDLCPVLDISFDDEADNSLRGRCYGKTVAAGHPQRGRFQGRRCAAAASRVAASISPATPAPALDAHHELPVIPLTRAELEAHELAVFRHFARGRSGR